MERHQDMQTIVILSVSYIWIISALVAWSLSPDVESSLMIRCYMAWFISTATLVQFGISSLKIPAKIKDVQEIVHDRKKDNYQQPQQ